MATASIPREQVIALLDELPQDRWPEAVRLLRSLIADSDARKEQRERVHPDEARLVEIAQRALSPEAAGRLHELRVREAAGRLSNGDRAELHVLEARAERIDMERTTALLSLARIRGVHVMEVVKDLGLAQEGRR
jgi:hypothetical protein